MVSESNMPLEEVEIRATGAADAAAIRDLLADLIETVGDTDRYPGTVDDILRNGFGATPHFEVLIAEADGTAIGLVLFFYNFSTWRSSLGVYVQDLHVVENYRSKGIGRRLLASAARRGRAQGCTHLRLSADPSNEAALAFYQRVGFSVRADEVICQVSDVDFDMLAEEKT